MTSDKIIETMAKAMAENDALDFDKILHPMQSMYLSHARAAFSAIEAAGLVIVPKSETLCVDEPCEYCGDGKRTGLPGNACENCMNTGLKYPKM